MTKQMILAQIIFLFLFLLSSCGGGDGSSGVCGDFQGIPSAEEVSQKPRDNAEAEVLALEASGGFVAPQSVYDRVVNDLNLLHSTFPVLENVIARSPWYDSSLTIRFSEQGEQDYQGGMYNAWDCHNEFYKVSAIEDESVDPLRNHRLNFEGRYNLTMLQGEYERLQDIVWVEPSGVLIGDGSDVCLQIEDGVYSYIFDEGSGDCPAGCLNHTYRGYSTDPSEEFTELGVYVKGNTDPPPWFTNLSKCTDWLSGPTAIPPPTAAIGQEFSLKYNQQANVTGEGLIIKFVSVEEDSRCPTGAECIWEGNAMVVLTATKTGNDSALLELNTYPAFPTKANYLTYTIEFKGLQPYPSLDVSINPAEYTAKLLVTKQ